MASANQQKTPSPAPPTRPFRRAVIRGLGVVLPPLLTIVIFLWVGSMVGRYVLEPLESIARHVVFWYEGDVKSGLENPDHPDVKSFDALSGIAVLKDGRKFVRVYDERLGKDQFVPAPIYEYVVDARNGDEKMPETARALYFRYVDLRYLRREIVVPLFLVAFIALLYFLGRFLAAGLGRFFVLRFEYLIHQLPVVRNVYGSVKQVTDFLFSERDMVEYTRVIAVEYPRKGIWSLGMVTGESMLDIRSAANEAVLTVLIPTSPAPFTGFTITVKKSETVDLNITIDQAFQFIISCGVVVPPQQIWSHLEKQKNLPAEAVSSVSSSDDQTASTD